MNIFLQALKLSKKKEAQDLLDLEEKSLNNKLGSERSKKVDRVALPKNAPILRGDEVIIIIIIIIF